MQAVSARAALVTTPEFGQGLTTSISRAEIEQAIRSENGPSELILDVTQFSDGEASETSNVAVAWEREDLEQLLGAAEGESVTLTFDGEMLRQAIEADIEAHGMKEKVLILAVAVTAGVGAGSAAATPLAPGPTVGDPVATFAASPDDRAFPRTSPTAVQPGVSADDRAVPRSAPVSQPSLSPDDRAVPFSAPVAEPTLSPDDRAVPFSAPVEQPSLSPDDRAVPFSAPVSEPTLSPDDRAVPFSAPVEQPSLSPDDRAVPFNTAPISQPQTAPADGDTWFSAPDPGTVAVIGGLALAITGAAFAAAAASRQRPTPA